MRNVFVASGTVHSLYLEIHYICTIVPLSFSIYFVVTDYLLYSQYVKVWCMLCLTKDIHLPVKQLELWLSTKWNWWLYLTHDAGWCRVRLRLFKLHKSQTLSHISVNGARRSESYKISSLFFITTSCMSLCGGMRKEYGQLSPSCLPSATSINFIWYSFCACRYFYM